MRNPHYITVLLLLAAQSTYSAANVFQNPGFETGDLAGWTVSTTPGGSATVGTDPPLIGQYYLNLYALGSNSSAIVSQTIPPVAVSQITQFTFYGRGGFRPGDYGYVIYQGGELVEFQMPGAWGQVNLRPLLNPTRLVSGIRFEVYGTSSFDAQLRADEIVLETAPEPGSGAILVLLIVCASRRRTT